jgi:hypothetical protein
MIANIDWDTGMVLSVILAPLSITLFIVCLTQWQRINEPKNDHKAAVTKADELQNQMDASMADFKRSFLHTSAQKDAEIQRQKEEIVKLHGDLNLTTQHLALHRQDAVRRDMHRDDVLPGESCL